MEKEQTVLISVIVPIYNTIHYLSRCVKSIINQTYTNLEILLIDDGSTDGSELLVDQFVAKDRRIKVIHQKNGGVSKARNVGLSIAQGDFIGFVDSDDWIVPEMFQTMITAAMESKKQIIICGIQIQFPDRRFRIKRSFEELHGTITRHQSVECLLSPYYFEGYLCNKLFKRSLIQQIGLRLDEELYFCEDLLFCIQLFLKTNGIYYIPNILYYYCMQTNGTMMSFNKKRLTELDARQKIIDLVDPISTKFGEAARCGYTDAAINMMYVFARNGHYKPIPLLKKQSMRYASIYFRSGSVEFRMKVRNLIAFAFPRVSSLLWKNLKKWFGLTWYKEFRI